MSAIHRDAQPTKRTAVLAFVFGVFMTALGVSMLVGGVPLGSIMIERDLFFGGVILAAGALGLLLTAMITVRYIKRKRQ